MRNATTSSRLLPLSCCCCHRATTTTDIAQAVRWCLTIKPLLQLKLFCQTIHCCQAVAIAVKSNHRDRHCQSCLLRSIHSYKLFKNVEPMMVLLLAVRLWLNIMEAQFLSPTPLGTGLMEGICGCQFCHCHMSNKSLHWSQSNRRWHLMTCLQKKIIWWILFFLAIWYWKWPLQMGFFICWITTIEMWVIFI